MIIHKNIENTNCGDCDTTWGRVDNNWLVPLYKKQITFNHTQVYWNTHGGDCGITWGIVDDDWLVFLCRKSSLHLWSCNYQGNSYCGDCDNIDKWIEEGGWVELLTEDSKLAAGDSAVVTVWPLPLISWFTIVIKASTDEHLSVITDLLQLYALVGKAILPLS